MPRFGVCCREQADLGPFLRRQEREFVGAYFWHVFGDPLDIAGLALADGRRVSVKEGLKGLPEEQGFLRDVQAARPVSNSPAALAPDSNAYHYNHIQADLMRRASGRLICQPAVRAV